MSGSEFDIIRRYFTRPPTDKPSVVLGVGDDAAVLEVPPGQQLVTCVDTLVEGVHFSDGASPAAIGYKSLAVNLSDIAAMGAEPAWATLALTLPGNNPSWLERFAEGFFTLADRYGIALVGGDTTRGPLSISVQVHGLVPKGQALTRTGSQPGDAVYVTGTLGDAGAALAFGLDEGHCHTRLNYPEPQVAAGRLLRSYAHACIDVSDGLLADLGHLLEGSDLGADIAVGNLPLSAAFRLAVAADDERFHSLPLGAGDDYELCFTVPGVRCAAMEAALAGAGIDFTRIGIITESCAIRCLDAAGRAIGVSLHGYDHFSGGR